MACSYGSRHLQACLLLALLAPLILTSCGSPLITSVATPNPMSTQAVAEPAFLSTQLAVISPSPAHPGDTVTVICKLAPTYQSGASAQFASAGYSIGLYGPFATRTDLQRTILTSTIGPPTWQNLLSVADVSGGTNGTQEQVLQSSFALPRTLASGVYDLVVTATLRGSRATARTDAVVQVMAP